MTNTSNSSFAIRSKFRRRVRKENSVTAGRIQGSVQIENPKTFCQPRFSSLPSAPELMKFPDAFSLNGEVALITGGGTGLGLSMAQCMAEAGAKVVITGRRESVLKDA